MREHRERFCFPLLAALVLLVALPTSPAPAEENPASPACGARLAARLPEKPWTPTVLEAAFGSDLEGAPGTLCRLRALYLAADQKGPGAEDLLKKAEALALTTLGGHTGWEGIERGDLEQRLSTAGPEEIPLLFWIGYLWGHRLKYESNLRAGLDRGDVVAILEFVTKAAPDTYGGGAPSFLGGYYASLPRLFGRDLKKAGVYFALSLQHSQGNLARKWTYARSYLRDSDEKGYRKLLEEMAAAEPAPQDPYYVESLLAREDARRELAAP